MRLERGMWPFISRKTVSYDSQDFQEIRVDEEPVLSTLASFAKGDADVEVFAPLIKLRCELKPIFNEKELYGTCSYNGKKYDPCALWGTQKKPLERIELVYTGYGSYFYKNDWKDFTGSNCAGYKMLFGKGITLYVKSFTTLTESLSLSMHLTAKEGTLFEPSAERTYRPFWGYGGSFYPQIKLSDIMQYYLTLDQDSKKTVVQSYSKQALWDKGIKMIKGELVQTKSLGKIVLMNANVANDHQSLEDDVLTGGIGVSLKSMSVTDYVSLTVKQLGLSGLMDITFQRRKS